jgi:hypothetical protein
MCRLCDESGTIEPMRPRTFAAAVATIAVLAPSASSGSAGAMRGEIFGHATKGPLSPVCSVSIPCYGPAAGARIGFENRHHVVYWTRADGNGDYRRSLAPGRYSVVSRIGMGVVDPAAVTVRPARDVRVDLDLDTGIR